MSDAGNNDWVAAELAKARAEYKNAYAESKGKLNDKTLRAGAKIDALKRGLIYKSTTEIKNQKTKMLTALDKKKQLETKASTECKAAIRMEKMAAVSVTFIGSHGSSDDRFIKKAKELYGMSLTKEDIKKFNKGWQDWMTKKYGDIRVDADNSGDLIKEYQKYLQAESKKKAKALKDAKLATRKYQGYVYQCEYALEYLKDRGTPTKGNSNAATLHDNSNSRGAGYSGGSSRGGSSGSSGGKTNKVKEEVLQTDENGNKLIRITDANGNQSFVVEDKDKNRKSIKDDEIKKTSVKPEDIQEAIQKSDWGKLLSLLLKAIDERAKQAQLGNDGQGNAPAQQTATKQYISEKGDVFTVTKEGANITSISMQEKGKNPFILTADELKHCEVAPADVEKMLEGNQFTQAGEKLLGVGYKTEKIIHSPEITLDGNNIILKDHYSYTKDRQEPLKLNEDYLVSECNMTKSKAKKAMENLRVLANSDKTNKAATQIVAKYLSRANPAPKMPEVQTTYGNPTLNRNPGGKIISITVTDSSGKKKELGYKDFAKAYGCSPEEAKKLRKECVRAIQNGQKVDGVLSFVANNSEGKSKFWTKTGTKIGTYVVGAAALGLGAYAAFGGFKKKNDGNEGTTLSTDESVDESEGVTTTGTSTPTNDTSASTGTSTSTNDPSTSNGTNTTTTTRINPSIPFIGLGNTR